MKMTNNTSESVQPLINGYLNTKQNDLFNYHFWDNKITIAEENIIKEYSLENYPLCEKSEAYENKGYDNFTMECNKLKSLENFKTKFEQSVSPQNMNILFEGKNFENPKLLNKPIDTVFSVSENINNFITYEKKPNPNDITQKHHNGKFFDYYTDETTEKSIYIKIE